MNSNDLKIFEAVALHSSFTKAAEATYTVQSNVTARIRSLEEEFGAPLFERSARKVSLTQAGEVLMRYSKQIAHLIEEAKRDISSVDALTGALKIGCIETTMALKVPEILKRFAEVHPQVELEFKSAMRGELIKDVLNYKLDAAFVPAPINNPDLHFEHISDEQLVLLASNKVPSIKSLFDPPAMLRIIVFDQGCVFRERLESWLSARGIAAYKPIVMNSLDGVINFVEAGLGISMLPADIISQYYAAKQIKTFAISKELGTMGTLLISRKDMPANRVLDEFIRLFRDHQ